MSIATGREGAQILLELRDRRLSLGGGGDRVWLPMPIVVSVVLADCWVGARFGEELCVLACPWPQQDPTVGQDHVRSTAASTVRHSIVPGPIETHSRNRRCSTTHVRGTANGDLVDLTPMDDSARSRVACGTGQVGTATPIRRRPRSAGRSTCLAHQIAPIAMHLC